MKVIPSDQEEQMILAEVRDHATYWHSDRCKRGTVEAHLRGKHACHPGRVGIADVEAKIDWLIVLGKLQVIPSRSGEYLKVSGEEVSA